MGKVRKRATLSAPGRRAALPRDSHAAVMHSVGSTAGGQEQLRLSQLKCSCPRKQQQHPVDQQVGDQPLHLCSLEHFPLAVRQFVESKS